MFHPCWLGASSPRTKTGSDSSALHPRKYVWFENYPASLYDLSWDSAEISDQARYKKDLLESFEARMRPLREAAGIEVDPEASGAGLSDQAIEALKQLGYAE